MIGAQGIFGGPGTESGSQPTNKPAGATGVWTSPDGERGRDLHRDALS